MKPLKIALFFQAMLIILNSCQGNKKYSEDFVEFWENTAANYAYLDKKHTDWNKVRETYLVKAHHVKNRDEFITLLENAIEELYDNHFILNTNLRSSTRLVPSGIDLWAEWIEGRAVITEVRSGFSADRSGIKAGMEIIAINGVPVEEAVRNRTGKCIDSVDDEVKNFVLRQLIAGTYLLPRNFTLKNNGTILEINPDSNSGNLADSLRYNSLIDSRIIEKNTGYIRFNNSLGETQVISTFDSVLNVLRNTDGLVIDLRETAGGGNSIVARGIMGRFITYEMPYQKHVLPNEDKEFRIRRSWLEIVSPRELFVYDKPVVVLVNHWTGSMGEGIAIGFDALKRGIIVGTKMAGLNGAISSFATAKLKIPYSFPTEQLFHIDGTPREKFIPPVYVDLTDHKNSGKEDPILTEGIRILDSINSASQNKKVSYEK